MTSTMRFDRWEKPDASQSVTFDQLVGGTGLVPISPTSVEKAGTGSTATANTLGAVSFSACTSLSLNGVFTSAYKRYQILFSMSASGNYPEPFIRLRAGTDSTSAVYTSTGIGVRTDNAVIGWSGGGQTRWSLGSLGTSSGNGELYSWRMELHNPQVASATSFQSQGIGVVTNYYTSFHHAGFFEGIAQFDGFTLFPSTTVSFTGNIQVFGYND